MHSIKKETNESDINNYLNLDSVKDEIVEVQIKSELPDELKMNEIERSFANANEAILLCFHKVFCFYQHRHLPNIMTQQIRSLIHSYELWIEKCSVVLQQLGLQNTAQIPTFSIVAVNHSQIKMEISNALAIVHDVTETIPLNNGTLIDGMRSRNAVLKAALTSLHEQIRSLPINVADFGVHRSPLLPKTNGLLEAMIQRSFPHFYAILFA